MSKKEACNSILKSCAKDVVGLEHNSHPSANDDEDCVFVEERVGVGVSMSVAFGPTWWSSAARSM